MLTSLFRLAALGLVLAMPLQAQSLPDWAAPSPATAPTDVVESMPPPPPPPPPPVPIDGGLGLLALAGAGLAARKLRRREG